MATKHADTDAAKKKTAITIAVSVAVAALVIALIMWVSSLSSCARWQEKMRSETQRGVERTVTAYSYTGEQIGQWTGTIDVDYSDDNQKVDMTFYDEDGNLVNRVILTNATVVIEEKDK